MKTSSEAGPLFECVQCGRSWPWKFRALDASPSPVVLVQDLVCGECELRRRGYEPWRRWPETG